MPNVTFATLVDPGSSPVPFAALRLHDADGRELLLDPARTAGDGQLVVELAEGSYRAIAFKLGFVFEPFVFDVVADVTVELRSHRLTTRWLQWEDLESTTTRDTIDQLFDDSNTGFRDMVLVESVINEAEALAESHLLRNWKPADILTLAKNDPAVRKQGAWIALEMASERKKQFTSDDGKGRFWVQYERAVEFFERLGKSQLHSRGEQHAGGGAQSGGARVPKLDRDQEPFIFAPGRNGREPGGF